MVGQLASIHPDLSTVRQPPNALGHKVSAADYIGDATRLGEIPDRVRSDAAARVQFAAVDDVKIDEVIRQLVLVQPLPASALERFSP